jgi:hypothetical protein
MRTWATHGWNDEIPGSQPADVRSGLDNLAERLMPDDKMVIARWRSAVLERADLAVRAADSDLEHADHHLVGLRQRRVGAANDLDLASDWECCDRFHPTELV